MSPTRTLRLAALVLCAAAPLAGVARASSLAVIEPPTVFRIAPLDDEDQTGKAMRAIADRGLYPTPRKRVAAFAMSLRDIRYRRAGREPATGFDCSGFTHYVYNQTYGVDLPFDAPSQFRNGTMVERSQLKSGDLVFFQERKHITHVGLYIGEGRFIHSPAPGKGVRVDELAAGYWAKRYAGARRPHVG